LIKIKGNALGKGKTLAGNYNRGRAADAILHWQLKKLTPPPIHHRVMSISFEQKQGHILSSGYEVDIKIQEKIFEEAANDYACMAPRSLTRYEVLVPLPTTAPGHKVS
jgi:hypothetical protein